MIDLSFSHLSDEVLLRTTPPAVGDERTKTAVVVARFAEIDARQLYRGVGYPSMHAFCVGEYGLCEQSAFKRIQAARAGRRFPAILQALADGRLHLTAVVMLAPHLNPQNAEELIAAATRQSRSAIERLLAERSPRPDVPTVVRQVSSCSQALTANQLSPGIVGSEPALPSGQVGSSPQATSERSGDEGQVAPERVEHGDQLAPDRVAAGHLLPPNLPDAGQQFSPQRGESQPSAALASSFQPRAKVTPLAPERYALQVTIGQGTHDKLRRAQELLSHALPSGNVAEVLDRALDSLIHGLEKRKFSATSKPRAKARASENPRHIPARVKRAVMARDEGRCTFVSDCGRRCSSRKFLEFDHTLEVARGGTANLSGIRLRCRAHNQYTAERTFGAGFMDEKRCAAAEAKSAAQARAATEAPAAASRSSVAGAAGRTPAIMAEPAVAKSTSVEWQEPPSLQATFEANVPPRLVTEPSPRARTAGRPRPSP